MKVRSRKTSKSVQESLKLTELMSLSAFGPANVFPQLWLLGSTRPLTSSPFLPRAIFHNQVLQDKDVRNKMQTSFNHNYFFNVYTQLLLVGDEWDLTTMIVTPIGAIRGVETNNL